MSAVRAVRETEAVYAVNELGKRRDPQQWSAEKRAMKPTSSVPGSNGALSRTCGTIRMPGRFSRNSSPRPSGKPRPCSTHPLQQYALFKNLADRLERRHVPGVPAALADTPHARAYYGVFRVVLGDRVFETMTPDEKQAYIDQALLIDAVVNTAVAEHSLNPQHIRSRDSQRAVARPVQTTRYGTGKTRY